MGTDRVNEGSWQGLAGQHDLEAAAIDVIVHIPDRFQHQAGPLQRPGVRQLTVIAA